MGRFKIKRGAKKIAFFLFVIVSGISAWGQTKPNIIIVYADDLGYADLSCQGSVPDVKTPNIDLLATRGIRFTNGYVSAPQCSPSRAGLITGRYQERYDFDAIPDGPLPLTEKTIANRLIEAGYVTGQVGKWHLEPNELEMKWGKKSMPDTIPVVNGRYTHIPEKLIDPYMPGNRGFDQFFTGYINNYKANFDLSGNLLAPKGVNIKQDGYRLDIQTDAALEFVKRNHEKPFFLYLCYYGPHVPLQATPKYLDRFPGKMAERRRHALAMISAIDDGVGKLYDLLRQYKIDKNTIIVFASDNGAPLKVTKEDLPISNTGGAWDGSLNDPMRGEKGMLAEGGIHVPFIISWSALPQGVLYHQPVSTLDIASTAVALAGLKPDKDLDGVNLIPFLTGKKTGSPHEALYWRFWDQSAVRFQNWKLIIAGNYGSYLFDLDKDPTETKNLIAEQPALANKLKQKLESWTRDLQPPGIPQKKLNAQELYWYQSYFK